MAQLKFETPAHKEANVNGYLLKVFESDPYYYVKVSKDGKDYDSHLLMDDEGEFETLKLKYERM